MHFWAKTETILLPKVFKNASEDATIQGRQEMELTALWMGVLELKSDLVVCLLVHHVRSSSLNIVLSTKL